MRTRRAPGELARTARRTLSQRGAARRHRNRILASLPSSEFRRIERDLSPFDLDHRVVLHDVGAPIRDVYFVERGIVSVLAATVDGTAVEVATVGPCYAIINGEFDRLLDGKGMSPLLRKIRRRVSEEVGHRTLGAARPPG